MRTRGRIFAAVALGALASACGSSGPGLSNGPAPVDAGPPRGDGGADHRTFGDGGDAAGDTDATAAPGRFITGVVSFAPAECAGFGAASMPDIVEGPPIGGGTSRGSTDVVSLGSGGSIVVSFGPNAIVDGPGPDFIVFENPFFIGGSSNNLYAEPGEVSVSDDGTTWHVFPCTPAIDPQSTLGTGTAPPYGQCAGWHVVYSTPDNGISPFDPAVSGGDAFDLANVGVAHARYVRIVDKTNEACPETGTRPRTNGFDLDAVSIVHAELP